MFKKRHTFSTSAVVKDTDSYDGIRELWSRYPKNGKYVRSEYPKLIDVFEGFTNIDTMAALFMMSSMENAMLMYRLDKKAHMNSVIVAAPVLKRKLNDARSRNAVYADLCFMWIYTDNPLIIE